MARKNKIGLDYFSHDVEMFNDIKIKFIKAKHGLIGYAIFLRLLENIYKENGYYIQIDDKFNILFADDNKLDINVYINVLNDCINENLFNKEIYEKHKVLTSKRIQLNFLAGAERRKLIELKKEFLLLTDDLLENDNIKIIDVYINSENDDISTQKEIESKKKKETKKEINISFEEFWEIYKKKIEKAKCMEKWNKLSDKDRELIMIHIPIYENSLSDLKYLKNPMTYLNSKMWLDIEETENNFIPKKELKEIDVIRSLGINI